MKLQFDKVYVLTLPSFKDRAIFINNQLNNLGINYQFIFGTDFGNINTDAKGYKIKYPNLYDYEFESTGRDFSCAINHYNAVYQAYEFGFEKILIMEDDICFIKDKTLVESIFNSIPKDADFVTYDPRFWEDSDFIKFKNDLSNSNKNYIRCNDYIFMFGGLMYALMNRKTMELYLNNQRNKLSVADQVCGLFRNPIVNKYICSKCICTDQFNIKNNFNIKEIKSDYKSYLCNYDNLNVKDFYTPNKYNEFFRTC